jgi:hypothetical protein
MSYCWWQCWVRGEIPACDGGYMMASQAVGAAVSCKHWLLADSLNYATASSNVIVDSL